MPMDQCSMNMLFTTSTKNLCIVFRSWRITGPLSLLFSLLAIVALGAGYEAVRAAARRYDAAVATRSPNRPGDDVDGQERRSLLGSGAQALRGDERRIRIIKALFYAVQVFYSFFIMLLFMTYQAHVMLAVAVGAFVGYLMFGEGPASKTAACH
ncbi:Ctr copper transporter [Myriangium duriaei CBS 260.36]|uniref:Copper transport protein n=1 Tax=Myriangium duriaei CBS 260.36 TaxID=1168546 RepID=A0A9P4MQT8_9PEZI|nr:Ctr copper transporter [Myriangium duriaei CBS 260.36]